MADPPGTRQPRRLSPLTPVVRAPILVLAVLGGSWRQLLEGGSVGLLGVALIVLAVLGGGYGLASWLRTTYWIDDRELRIDTGVVFRQSRRIRIDRLQGVELLQPLVARLFGLAELRFDTAGGDREGRLAFLPHQEAQELRRLLLLRRDVLGGVAAVPAVAGAAAEGAPAASGPSEAARAAPVPPVEERLLARLDPRLLLASLALSTEAALGLLGAVVALVVAAATGTVAVAGLVVPGAIALVLGVGGRLTAFYGFTLTESPAGLHVRRGLTSLTSQTITLERIQGLVVGEPLLWRPLGWARLEVSVAGQASVEADGTQPSSTVLPVATKKEVLALVSHLLGGAEPEGVASTRPPRRAAWLSPLTWWNLSLGQDRELAVSHRGWWVRRTDVVPHARVQSLRLTQGPVQRRLGVADVRVDSPPGPVQVVGRHCEEAFARAFVAEAVVHARAARRRTSDPSAGVVGHVTESTSQIP